MSERPDHVRCENCCYWWKYEGNRGECRRSPPSKRPMEDTDDGVFGQWRDTEPGQWCGEFRAEWPAPSDDLDGYPVP